MLDMVDRLTLQNNALRGRIVRAYWVEVYYTFFLLVLAVHWTQKGGVKRLKQPEIEAVDLLMGLALSAIMVGG